MSLLVFDNRTLQLSIKVGVLERYEPTLKIREVYEDIEKLKINFKNKVIEITEKSTNEEINKVLENHPDKMDMFQQFLKTEMNDSILKINKKISEINKDICPNYKE